MVQVEEFGDGAVEELENNPDTPITWDSGLGLRWSAADGGMEASIFLLEHFCFYQLILSEPEDLSTYEVRLDASLQNLRSWMSELINHPLFYQTIPDSYDTYSQALAAQLAQHEQVFSRALTSFKELYLLKLNYDQKATNLLELTEEVEELGDATVENELERVQQLGDFMTQLLLGATASAIVLTYVLVKTNTRLLRKLVENLNSASEQLAEASQQIAHSSNRVANAASQQAVSVEETPASLSEISGQVRDNLNSASNVAEAIVHMTQIVKQNDEKTKLSTQYSHEARLAAERGTSAGNDITQSMQETQSRAILEDLIQTEQFIDRQPTSDCRPNQTLGKYQQQGVYNQCSLDTQIFQTL